ncbi:unnamed protein product [Gongylonema pulchrum]|uniref:ABC transporter domain-containing protein n=1 Tax=Gongylonema pulchrum TaxID=637853 RepID=A0A183DF41_9BILA|nr:unnamed protein product [Gongylonema pulchrum]
MRSLLEVLSNSMSRRYLVSGKLENNGRELNVKEFGERVAYVNAMDAYPWLTVAQTLRLASSFISPTTNAFKSTEMVEQLIETLALSPYRNFLCGELGRTEKQRLKLAIEILKDTDVLLTDNVTKDMDLYDMAFVIDYVRDWAIKLSRTAVMAIQPPTLEILTMFRKGNDNNK